MMDYFDLYTHLSHLKRTAATVCILDRLCAFFDTHPDCQALTLHLRKDVPVHLKADSGSTQSVEQVDEVLDYLLSYFERSEIIGVFTPTDKSTVAPDGGPWSCRVLRSERAHQVRADAQRRLLESLAGTDLGEMLKG